MLLAEQLMLLLLDVRAGTVRTHHGIEASTLCAAALLIELAAQRRLALAGGLLRGESELPATDPLLDQVRRMLARHPLAPDAAIGAIERHTAPLPQHLLDRLYRRDFLHRERGWRFWRAPRYPLRSHQARNEAVDHLRQSATNPTASADAVGLLLLADVAGVLAMFLPAVEYEQASAALFHLERSAQNDTARSVLVQVRRSLIDG